MTAKLPGVKSILPPKSDFVFKQIFGSEKNVDILADFLQSVLDLPKEEYKELQILDPHLKRRQKDEKEGVLDVKIHTAGGKVVNVEIQLLETPQMRERIVYYLGRMITEQIGKGEEYREIKKAVSIVITDYLLIKENKAYHNRYRLYDHKTKSEFTDVVEVNTLEMPKLPIRSDKTALFDWLAFLKSTEEEEFRMLAKKSPELNKAVGILVELSRNERARMLYEEREKARRDQAARMKGAWEDGLQEGERIGKIEGERIGKIEGERIGEIKGKLSVAQNLLEEGMSMEQAAKITGLSVEEINDLTGR
jgi:predicted transposase/invertase (TIGR01784 family)